MMLYYNVVGSRIPYGARGKRLHKGPKRTTVDFGKLGVWRVPHDYLSIKKPDPVFGKAAKEALEVFREMGLA